MLVRISADNSPTLFENTFDSTNSNQTTSSVLAMRRYHTTEWDRRKKLEENLESMEDHALLGNCCVIPRLFTRIRCERAKCLRERMESNEVMMRRYGKSLKRKWRRGQDSNLHSLSAGGFQDRCTTIMRPLRKGCGGEYSVS